MFYAFTTKLRVKILNLNFKKSVYELRFSTNSGQHECLVDYDDNFCRPDLSSRQISSPFVSPRRRYPLQNLQTNKVTNSKRYVPSMPIGMWVNGKNFVKLVGCPDMKVFQCLSEKKYNMIVVFNICNVKPPLAILFK